MTQQQQNLIFVTARASFPWIADPQVTTDAKTGEKKTSYNTDLILAPNDPAFAKFMQAYAQLAGEKWKENAQAAMQRIQSDRKTRCYGAGEEKVNTKTFQVHPGYAGNVFISARSPRQPQIIKPDGAPCDPTNTLETRAYASKIYGGCYINAVIKPWLQQNDSGIGIRCDLIAVQFKADGESFGAGAADVTGFFGAVAPAAGFAPVAAAPAMPAAPFPGMPSFLG
jgi:lipoprotein-anchoring transpeptidase ErfK/SrfK